MPNPQISRLRMLGLLFCLLGGTLITFGWMGTARVACVDCQVPYLLSGGAAGLALIVIGVGLLVIAQLRAEGDKLAGRLGDLVAPPVDPTDDPVIPAQRGGTSDTEQLSLAGTADSPDHPTPTDDGLDGKADSRYDPADASDAGAQPESRGTADTTGDATR